MRKVIFGGAISLDNFIARSDNAVDWLVWSDDVQKIMAEMWPRFDCMVMGRKTYEVGVGKGEEEKRGKGEEEKEAEKNPFGMETYVFSRTLEAGKHGGVEFVDSDPGEFVRELKKLDGKEIMVMGGGDLGRNLFEAGVIDEIGFNIQPVLLGSGVPLYHEMSRQIDLELIECRQLSGGCVYVTYRVKSLSTTD
ncbi:MAG: dihydrofolate reductase family protein [Pyrinomonadaceae bacterium]